jgi:hypothetical protein
MADELLAGIATGLAGVPGVQQRYGTAVKQEELMGMQRERFGMERAAEKRRKTKHQMETDAYNRALSELEKNEKSMDTMDEWVKANLTEKQAKAYGVERRDFTNDAKGRIDRSFRIASILSQRKDAETFATEHEGDTLDISPRMTEAEWKAYKTGRGKEAKKKKTRTDIEAGFAEDVPKFKRGAAKIVRKKGGIGAFEDPAVKGFLGTFGTETEAMRAARAGGKDRDVQERLWRTSLDKVSADLEKMKKEKTGIDAKLAEMTPEEPAYDVWDKRATELGKAITKKEKEKQNWQDRIGELDIRVHKEKAEKEPTAEERKKATIETVAGMVGPGIVGGMGAETAAPPTEIPSKIPPYLRREAPAGGMGEQPVSYTPTQMPTVKRLKAAGYDDADIRAYLQTKGIR